MIFAANLINRAKAFFHLTRRFKPLLYPYEHYECSLNVNNDRMFLLFKCRHCGEIINDEKAVTVLDLEAHYANCNGRNDKI